MTQPTQEQMFHQASREVNDTVQQAYWMAGKMPDSQGRINENPMTDKEIRNAAASGRPYAYAFQMIIERAEQAENKTEN